MRRETKNKIIAFFAGLVVVTFLTLIGTLAFFEGEILDVVRNVVITDLIFVVLYMLWIKLHKGYEQIYKSGLEEEK